MNLDCNNVLPFPENSRDIKFDGKVGRLITVLGKGVRIYCPVRHEKRPYRDPVDIDHAAIVDSKIGNPLFLAGLTRTQGERISEKVCSNQILTIRPVSDPSQRVGSRCWKSLHYPSLQRKNSHGPGSDSRCGHLEIDTVPISPRSIDRITHSRPKLVFQLIQVIPLTIKERIDCSSATIQICRDQRPGLGVQY